MMMKTTHLKLVLFLATICGHTQLSQATPLVSDSLNYRGALFTLESGWVENRYLVTYRADFSGFQGDADQAYIKAIDWNWVEGGIDSVELKSAPGHSTDWDTQQYQQIGLGDALGCGTGASQDAVCTQYSGSGAGFSALDSTEDLSWVFEISFRTFRQRDVMFNGGFTAALVDGKGFLSAPIMACNTQQNPGCPDVPAPLTELQEDNGSVPVPGVPALLLAGLAGLFISRRRPNRS